MYSIEEIKMEIGEHIQLYIRNNKTEQAKKISEDEFSKLKPSKQTEILLDIIRYLHANLKDDLRSIWERIDKLEQ